MNKEISEKEQQAFLINKRERKQKLWNEQLQEKKQINTQQYGIFFFEYKQFAVITLISVVNKF